MQEILLFFREKNTYTTLLGPTRLLISEKSATYTIKWSYTIIWQVRVSIAVNPQDVKMVNSTSVQCCVQTGYNVTKERQSAIEIACRKKLCHLLHKTKSFDARATSEYHHSN